MSTPSTQHLSPVRTVQADGMAQQDRFPRSRPAQDHHRLPAGDAEVHPAEHSLVVEGLVEVDVLYE